MLNTGCFPPNRDGCLLKDQISRIWPRVLQSWLGLGTFVCAFVFALGWAWLTGALLGLKVKFIESSLSYTNSRLTHGRVEVDSWIEARGDLILCDAWCLGEVHVARCDMVTVGYKSNLCGNSQALTYLNILHGMFRANRTGRCRTHEFCDKRSGTGGCFAIGAVRWANFPSAELIPIKFW